MILRISYLQLLHSPVAVPSLEVTCTVISFDDGLLILAVNVTVPILSTKLLDVSVNSTVAAEIVQFFN